jgi:hypothetical protein
MVLSVLVAAAALACACGDGAAAAAAAAAASRAPVATPSAYPSSTTVYVGPPAVTLRWRVDAASVSYRLEASGAGSADGMWLGIARATCNGMINWKHPDTDGDSPCSGPAVIGLPSTNETGQYLLLGKDASASVRCWRGRGAAPKARTAAAANNSSPLTLSSLAAVNFTRELADAQRRIHIRVGRRDGAGVDAADSGDG